MADEFFEMLDDMKLQNVRLFGDLLTPDGAEVLRWDCSYGRYVNWAGQLTAKVIKEGRPLDLSSNTCRTWIASAKTKQVIDRFAPESVQYFPVEVKGDSEPYFVTNILRRIACLDEKLSYVERTPVDDKKRPDLAGKVSMILDLHILSGRAEGEHLFRLDESAIHVIVSRQLKEALEQAGIAGVKFESVSAPEIADFRKQFAERQRQRGNSH